MATQNIFFIDSRIDDYQALLGSTVLSNVNVNSYSSQLSSIGSSLNDSGEILLYGCNVAADPAGESFVSTLAKWTHADIAASDDFTGSVAAGGDWMLESHTGAIEAVALQCDGFVGLMAVVPAVDLGDVATGTGGFVIYGEDSLDQSGWSVSSAGDVNGDGFDDVIVGALGGDGAGNAKGNAGDSYVVFGKANGFGPSINLINVAAGAGGFVIHGQDAGDWSGASVASAGDINGDGFDDLIIGAYRADAAANAKNHAGDSYVVFGKAGGFGASINLVNVAGGTGGFVIYGQDADDYSGLSVASAGDINGDGFDDLFIGARVAYGASNSKANAGDSYVMFGKSKGFGASIDLANVASGKGGFVIHGEDAGDSSGYSVASAGDINGDGFDDLIIGAVGGDAAANVKSNAGDSYVIFGRANGFGASIDLANVAAGAGGFVVHGQDAGDSSGCSVASAGDINGDGFDDLIIGARSGGAGANAKAYAGDSYVVFGKASGFGASIDLANVAAGTGGFVIYGQDAGDYSGFAVASAGDMNGDGFDDLLIGAEGGDGADNAITNAGDSYVVFGKANGFGASINLVNIAAGTGGFVIHGQDTQDNSGASVASLGDINGDGFDDLIIGAAHGDAAGNAKVEAGESYVLFGKDFTGTVTHAGTTAADTLIGTTGADIMVAGLGKDTVNGAAGADAINGGSGNDILSGGAGADRIDGGNGRDTASYASSAAAVTVNLATDRNGGGDAAGDHLDSIENLVGSTLADKLSGDQGANNLDSGAGNDTLVGGPGNDTLSGGVGADSLSGGTGNDRYIGSIGDVLLENLNEGTDKVVSDTNFTLGANFENLALTGTANLYGNGNTLANSLTGNNGNNLLQGGTGNDTLSGGAGNDSLNGGDGNEMLTGGAGADAFVFGNGLSAATNIDTITDFTHLSDKLQLDDDIFTQLHGGVALLAGQLYVGAGVTAAHDLDDRLIYNTTTGALYYDADGTGAASTAIKFAVLGTTTHPTLSIGDFAIVV